CRAGRGCDPRPHGRWRAAHPDENVTCDIFRTRQGARRSASRETCTMKTFWLAAAAAAALSAAAPALAADAGAALPAQTSGQTAGTAPSLTETPRMGPWGFDMAGRDITTP